MPRPPTPTRRAGRAIAGTALVALALTSCSSDAGRSPVASSPSSVGPIVASVPDAEPPPAGSAPLSMPAPDASSPITVGSVAAQITTTTVDPSAPTACSLLMLDELGFGTGEGRTYGEGEAAEPQETPYGAHTACTWTTTKGPDATVRVSVWDMSTAFDDARVQVGVTGEVDGVGERAFSSTLSSIYAVAGGHTLFVQVEDLERDPAELLAVTTSLAQLAAGRL